MGLAVMLATALILTGLGPITEDGRLFSDSLLLIAVVGGGGIIARRVAGAGVAARLLQAGAGLAALTVLGAASGVSGPGQLPGLVQDALRWTVLSSAPMGPNTGVRLIAVAAIGVLAFLADQLAVGYGHPAWTLLPLAVPYLVTALALPALVTFWPLLWLAVGYVGVLLAEAANRNRALRFQAADGSRWSLLLGGGAMLLTGLLVAGLAGVFTPGLDAGRGAPFSGQGPVEMGDPSLDLRRNLQMPVDRPVLDYTTSTGTGVYLRLTSLPAFDATGFHLNAIDLFEGNLPAPQGAPADSPRYSIDVTVGDFNSEWLPLPYAPASFTASGQWRHDPQSLSVLAAGAGQKQATNALRYQATVIDTTPSGERVRAAAAGYPVDGSTTAAVPDDLPQRIRELAQNITADAATDGEKALLIQQWLRSSRFRYSTEPAPGSGYEALTRFLFDDRTGYCEQFATSMAVLARAVGIPARVAVGFLPGDRVGDGWEVSIRDMHAWPELYFGTLGWVAFEPTPGVATPPSYTLPVSEEAPTPSASATPSPSAQTEEPTAEPTADVDEPEPEAVAADLTWLGWTAAGLLVTLAAGVTPALLRRLRQARRLELRQPRQAVAAAWEEVRDTVWDAGAEWPQGSARQIGTRVADDLGPDAAAAMGRVAVLVERARYAESLGDVGQLGADVERVRAGIEAVRRPPWWRRLFPRSLWRGLWWKG